MKIRQILYLHRTQGMGVERVHISGIANAFRAAGCRVDICSPAGMELDGADAAAESGGGAHGLSRLSRYTPELVFELMEMLYNLIALRQVRQCGLERYDLIFERYAIFSCAGLILARIRKIPFVLEVNYTSSSPLVRQRSRLLKPLAFALDKLLFRSATLLTPVSSALQRELIEVFHVPESKIVVLANAVDPASFTPRSHPTDGAGRIIGFVGGFYPWHGLNLLIDAFKLIHGQFPQARIMLVGDGPELAAIKQQVETLGLMYSVTFAGRVNHGQLPDLMRNFHVGVMPDSNDYGSPMKIFEYMALGVPVIAPDYSPIQDVITHGQQGLIFRRRDIAALAAALGRVLADDDLAKTMGEAGRACVEKEHNWNANVAKITAALSRPSDMKHCNPPAGVRR